MVRSRRPARQLAILATLLCAPLRSAAGSKGGGCRAGAGYTPSLVNFRGDMLRAFRDQGHEVFCCSPDPDDATLVVRLKHDSRFVNHNIGRFRIRAK